jgi:hypothetical protein
MAISISILVSSAPGIVLPWGKTLVDRNSDGNNESIRLNEEMERKAGIKTDVAIKEPTKVGFGVRN